MTRGRQKGINFCLVCIREILVKYFLHCHACSSCVEYIHIIREWIWPVLSQHCPVGSRRLSWSSSARPGERSLPMAAWPAGVQLNQGYLEILKSPSCCSDQRSNHPARSTACSNTMYIWWVWLRWQIINYEGRNSRTGQAYTESS